MKHGPNPPEATKWKPGQTGNPNGRPRKLPSIDKLMANVLGDENDPNSNAYKILEALVKKARSGDARAAEILLDRGFGRPKQQVEIHGDPVKTFIVKRASDRSQGT